MHILALDTSTAWVSVAVFDGQSAVAIRAFHDAVRLGDIRAVDSIARLTDEVDCVFGRLALQHARAFVASDAVELDAVSTAFADIGMSGAAADASAQANRLRG